MNRRPTRGRFPRSGFRGRGMPFVPRRGVRGVLANRGGGFPKLSSYSHPLLDERRSISPVRPSHPERLSRSRSPSYSSGRRAYSPVPIGHSPLSPEGRFQDLPKSSWSPQSKDTDDTLLRCETDEAESLRITVGNELYKDNLRKTSALERLGPPINTHAESDSYRNSRVKRTAGSFEGSEVEYTEAGAHLQRPQSMETFIKEFFPKFRSLGKSNERQRSSDRFSDAAKELSIEKRRQHLDSDRSRSRDLNAYECKLRHRERSNSGKRYRSHSRERHYGKRRRYSRSRSRSADYHRKYHRTGRARELIASYSPVSSTKSSSSSGSSSSHSSRSSQSRHRSRSASRSRHGSKSTSRSRSRSAARETKQGPKSILKKKNLQIPLEEPSVPGIHVVDYSHGQPTETQSLTVVDVLKSTSAYPLPQDIEDEETFLYGNDDPKVFNETSGTSSLVHQIPTIDKHLINRESSSSQFGSSGNQQALSSSTSVLPALQPGFSTSKSTAYAHSLPFRPLQHHSEQGCTQNAAAPPEPHYEPVSRETQPSKSVLRNKPKTSEGSNSNVLQDILQSIGFNFDKSLETQTRSQQQDSADFNQSGSFLLGGIDAIIKDARKTAEEARMRQGQNSPAAKLENMFPFSQSNIPTGQDMPLSSTYEPSIQRTSLDNPTSALIPINTLDQSTSQYSKAYADHRCDFSERNVYESVHHHYQATEEKHFPHFDSQKGDKRSHVNEELKSKVRLNEQSATSSELQNELFAAEKSKLNKKRANYIKQFRSLESELMYLHKHQGELMRRARKNKDGHKDPMIVESSRLIREIVKQMDILKKNVEENGRLLNLQDPLSDLTETSKEKNLVKAKNEKKQEFEAAESCPTDMQDENLYQRREQVALSQTRPRIVHSPLVENRDVVDKTEKKHESVVEVPQPIHRIVRGFIDTKGLPVQAQGYCTSIQKMRPDERFSLQSKEGMSKYKYKCESASDETKPQMKHVQGLVEAKQPLQKYMQAFYNEETNLAEESRSKKDYIRESSTEKASEGKKYATQSPADESNFRKRYKQEACKRVYVSPKRDQPVDTSLNICYKQSDVEGKHLMYTSSHSEQKADRDREKSVKSITTQREYFDTEDHWCKSCNCVLKTYNDLLNHLHNRQHFGNMDKHDIPWQSERVKNPPKRDNSMKLLLPFKGAEFLMPINGFYCRLCKTFLGDNPCAEDHIKSQEHNNMYEKYAHENPYYEKRYELEKATGMAEFQAAKQKQEETSLKLYEQQKKVKETQSVVERVRKVSKSLDDNSDDDADDDSNVKSLEKSEESKVHSITKPNTEARRLANKSKTVGRKERFDYATGIRITLNKKDERKLQLSALPQDVSSSESESDFQPKVRKIYRNRSNRSPEGSKSMERSRSREYSRSRKHSRSREHSRSSDYSSSERNKRHHSRSAERYKSKERSISRESRDSNACKDHVAFKTKIEQGSKQSSTLNEYTRQVENDPSGYRQRERERRKAEEKQKIEQCKEDEKHKGDVPKKQDGRISIKFITGKMRAKRLPQAQKIAASVAASSSVPTYPRNTLKSIETKPTVDKFLSLNKPNETQGLPLHKDSMLHSPIKSVNQNASKLLTSTAGASPVSPYERKAHLPTPHPLDRFQSESHYKVTTTFASATHVSQFPRNTLYPKGNSVQNTSLSLNQSAKIPSPSVIEKEPVLHLPKFQIKGIEQEIFKPNTTQSISLPLEPPPPGTMPVSVPPKDPQQQLDDLSVQICAPVESSGFYCRMKPNSSSQEPEQTISSSLAKAEQKKQRFSKKEAYEEPLPPGLDLEDGEPPPPGTELLSGQEILASDEIEHPEIDDVESEGSGISMYMGSDTEET